jgi:type IV secretion system protein VirB9
LIYYTLRLIFVSLLFLALMATLGLLLAGCTQDAPPPPPVPPAPEDLSTWAVPELVQPSPRPVPVPAPPKDTPTSVEEILDYAPGTTYTLHVSTGAPLDVLLERGEEVRDFIGANNTPVEVEQAPEAAATAKSPWDIKKGSEGLGDTLRWHLFVTVTKPGLSLGLVITTTKRTYYLTCKSVAKSAVRVARWRYPVDPVAQAPVKTPGLLPDPNEPRRYHVGYDLTSPHKQPPDFLPRHVVDDGKKMYIVFPEITLFETAPLVRMIGPNGPALVNARQYLNVLIIDQLAPRLELRVGLGEQADVVQIARGGLRTIHCPDAPECPVWPRAALELERRHP